jgi:hypothetical protein
MWFEVAILPWAVNIILFVIFFIVAEGTRWQKHGILGPFARFIQASAARGFFVFLLLTLLMVPLTLLILHGYWFDLFVLGLEASGTTQVVNTLLIIILLLAMSIPVMWSHFRTWRQAVRSAAEVRVRTSE